MNAPHEALTIERLSVRFSAAAPLDPRRCDAWLTALGDADGDALTAGIIEPDAWLLVRRLPLTLRWRADSSASDALAHWQSGLREALSRAIDRPEQSAVVHYRRRHAALADLLYRSALGDASRQWAWRRMDLLPGDALTPAEALGHGLRHLLAEPERIWPVLNCLVTAEGATASLTAVLRAIPVGDWRRLLAASPRTAGFVEIALGEPETGAQRGEGSPSIPPAGKVAGPGSQAAAAGAVIASPPLSASGMALVRWLAQRPHLPASSRAVTVLLAAAMSASAGTLAPAARRHLIASIRARLDHPSAAVATPPSAGERPRAAVRPPPTRADDLPPLPALADAQQRLSTAWGGALFWLGRVAAGGLLDWQAAQDTVSLARLLRALGDGLGVPDDDPALRAFCGGELAPVLPEGPAFAPARARIAQQLAHWSAWLDAMAPELEPPRLERVCRRSGELRFEAGWIELHLPLQSVDTSLRRLGLDLDPGWLPWLGCVLRIIYDDQG